MAEGLSHAEGSLKGEECVSNALDAFERPFLETSVEHCYWTCYNPQNSISETSNSINFIVPPSDDHVDLNGNYS